ncbi:hypothetical protein HMI54_015788 [Coelomomyces lativittatus]|nr:hypothetical protein HMI55_000862 [Coelomomyces lativittatus]KAJ1512324.1 hypothetical protein HMI54_015788 [Coelomomyces lativittatus]
MVDIALILTASIFAILVLIGSVYFLVYFQHPDDKWAAWFPKLLVILGISLSCYNIFLLPLDVANQNGLFTATGGLPMQLLNFIFFLSTIIMAGVLVPFVMFYYEGVDDDDDDGESTTVSTSAQILYAVKWTLPTLIIFGIIGYVLWAYAGTVKISVDVLTSPLLSGDNYTANYCGALNACNETSTVNTIHVSPLISTVAYATLVGWFLFAVFCGVGLVALPFDLLMEFKNRPKPIKADVYQQRKKIIGEQATLLLQAANDMQEEQKALGKVARKKFNRKARSFRQKENEFKRDVLLLEAQYQLLEESHKSANGKALYYILMAFIGFIGIFLSLAWILHICIYMVPPIVGQMALTTFLNDFLITVSNVPFVGVAIYAILTFWLMLCTIKGTTKLGMRLIFFTIHPMKIGETMMSSIIFNVGLILICSLAVTQFSTMALSRYARFTSSQTLFMATIHNLAELHYVYDILIFVILGFVGLTGIYSVYKPYRGRQLKDRRGEIKF